MKPCTLLAAAVLATAGLAAQAMPASQGPTLKGEVLEAKDVQAYTYLRLKTKDGEIWAAVPAASVKKGAQVTLDNPMVMENFESKSLKKKFDKLVFATLADPNAKPLPAAATSHGPSPASTAPIAKIAKATAADAKTVAEVVAGTAELKDKTVTIRGQVVKYTSGVMGKNWVHLQDGSGSAASRNHDILVTTADTTAVGEVINASGTVRTNMDFGAGYAYAVLVEGAKIRK